MLANTVAKALTAKKPKSRYLAGHGAEAAAALARTATDHMKDRAVAHEAHLRRRSSGRFLLASFLGRRRMHALMKSGKQ